MSDTLPAWSIELASTAGYVALLLTLVLLAVAAWMTNFVTLPGNWLVVLLAAGVWFIETEDGRVMSLLGLLTLLALAGLGELLEFFASAAGAAKQGASRRGLALSLAGAMGGSIGGAILGVPIPVVGSLIAAVLGGGIGAFAGAYLGEYWKRTREHPDRLAIARAAFSGRLLGTVGKLLVGSIMLVVFAVAMVV